MGFLKKIKFCKKRNNNTPTKVDACVSTEDPWTCNAVTMSMDPNVMCAAYTQAETRMDGGGGAVKEEYEREFEMKNQKIRELEEELAVSKRLTADLMLNMNSIEQQVRKYVEEPVIIWLDDCERKQQVSAVADLLKNLSSWRGMQITQSKKPHLARTPKSTAKPKQKQTAGRGIVPTLISRKL